jgi:N-acetyl-anhydromuramyl-L-alanine amidase AmpD
MLERIKWEIGRNFADPDFGESFFSKCLVVSPALWDFSLSLPPSGVAAVANPPAHPLTRPSIAALARIAAHVPLYGLPKNLFQITGFVPRLVANRAFASCYLWGNQNESLGNDDLPEVTEQINYSIDEAPSVRILFQVPTEIRHPEERAGTNRVFPFLVVATPNPVLPNPQPPGFRAPDLGAIDNLFALSPDDFNYLNVPDGQIDEKASMTSHEREAYAAQDWALTGKPAHRVYQLAVASDASNAPPRSRKVGNERNWNARNLSYVDGAGAPMLQAAPAFSVLSSESKQDLRVTWPGRRLSFFSDANHGRTVVLMRAGHRVIPQVTADVFLGNRFRLIANQVDDNQLGGIRVMIDGLQRAVTEPNGRAPGLQAFLSIQPDGTHALSIAGQGITLNQPPGPGTARPQARNRIWRERTFQILTQGGQIIRVDDEPVVAQGVRILLDPVYMRWRVGFSVAANGAINHRAGNVQMVIIHRTDLNDSVATADAKVQPGGRPFFSQYFLARDGTLIKGADENEIMNHAPGRWQSAPGNILFTNASGVGVEISKLDSGNWYTDAQYETLLWLLAEYVSANPPVDPLNIVGHSDVQQEGRDDPGLAFEWARLEAAGFGIIRDAQAALLAPLPAWPTQQVDAARAANQEVRLPTATFLASINQDVNAFQNLFQNELAQQNPDAAVRQRVRALLEEIGYHQTGVDVDHPQPPQTDFNTELLAFRSHFFAGARRIYFAFLPEHVGQPLGQHNQRVVHEDELLRRALENNPVNMRDLTAVWALRVRDHVVAQRQAANPPRPARRPVPPAAR